MKQTLLILLCFLFITSCAEENIYIPKPRTYPRIDFPIKEYQAFDASFCDMTFNYPAYSHINKEETFFEEKPKHECWFDIIIPKLNGKIHCNYNPINGRTSFDKLINDAYTMAGKHNIKAEFYKETALQFPNNVSGIIFEIEGDVATPIQFYLTDSTNHFFRGSLYFNNKVNVDSMAPVYKFVKTDIDTLIESFRWK